MTWVIIAIVLLAAFGPVLWILPSRRDRRLTALREAARQAGLVVEIKQIPKTNPSAEERVSAGGALRNPVRDCAAYQRILPSKLEHLPSWRLLASEGADDGPFPGWVLDPHLAASTPHFRATLELIRPWLEGLPGGILGVEVTSRAVMVFWLEGASATVEDVAALARALDKLSAQLEALEGEIEQALLDEDS